jgi:hypothetical protein
MKRYIDEVYDSSCCLIDGDVCSVRSCRETPVDSLWVTVSGKSILLKFCRKHKVEEMEGEELYRAGL